MVGSGCDLSTQFFYMLFDVFNAPIECWVSMFSHSLRCSHLCMPCDGLYSVIVFLTIFTGFWFTRIGKLFSLFLIQTYVVDTNKKTSR